MAHLISFVKILFLQSIIYENCLTDNAADCRYTDFQFAGVSSSTLDRCGSQSKNLFMGPYGYSTRVTRTFTNVPPNKQFEFQVGIWKFDSWDEEGLKFYANDQQIGSLTLGNSDGTMICRNTWEDQLRHFSLKFQITGTDLTIMLNDNLNSSPGEDLMDESWGFRDVILRLAVPCVNFYSECNYVGTLFQICQGEQTKLQNYIPIEIKSIRMGPGIIVKLKDNKYFSGVLQEFTSSQPCLTAQNKQFQFSKVIYQE